MEVTSEHLADENKRLQRCINDLVGVLALPSMWTGTERPLIVSTLIDALTGMLGLDFVYVRLEVEADQVPVEMVRVVQWRGATRLPHEVGTMLNQWLGDDTTRWPCAMRCEMDGEDISIVPQQLGLHGKIGVVVAGSRRADFPLQTERLLLSVATNQASISLQEERLLSDQKRIAEELDRRVAQRTGELTAVNEELKKEIARRMLEEERRRQSEQERGRLQSELAHATRASSLGVMTASIAHEIRQPLGVIVINAGTCVRKLTADPPDIDGARVTARRMILDANKASDMMTRLRALFTKKDMEKGLLDLNEAAREVVALLSDDLERTRVILRSEFSGDLPQVIGDRLQLQQVILNLLRNSTDSMREVEGRPRQLVIRTERDESDCVRLTVRDAGVGFDPRRADKLFEAFHSTKSDGMGIGLCVSRSIIESHRGRLWAAPNDGPGATFAFSIPCDPDCQAPPQEEADCGETHGPSNCAVATALSRKGSSGQGNWAVWESRRIPLQGRRSLPSDPRVRYETAKSQAGVSLYTAIFRKS